MYNIPFHKCATFLVFIHQLMYAYVLFNFWLLWLQQQWTWISKCHGIVLWVCAQGCYNWIEVDWLPASWKKLHLYFHNDCSGAHSNQHMLSPVLWSWPFDRCQLAFPWYIKLLSISLSVSSTICVPPVEALLSFILHF